MSTHRSPAVVCAQTVRRCLECLDFCPDVALAITDPETSKTFVVTPVCERCAPNVAAEVVRKLRLGSSCTWSRGSITKQSLAPQGLSHVSDAVGDVMCKAAFYRICVAALTEAENLALTEPQKLERVLEVLQEYCAKEV